MKGQSDPSKALLVPTPLQKLEYSLFCAAFRLLGIRADCQQSLVNCLTLLLSGLAPQLFLLAATKIGTEKVGFWVNALRVPIAPHLASLQLKDSCTVAPTPFSQNVKFWNSCSGIIGSYQLFNLQVHANVLPVKYTISFVKLSDFCEGFFQRNP